MDHEAAGRGRLRQRSLSIDGGRRASSSHDFTHIATTLPEISQNPRTPLMVSLALREGIRRSQDLGGHDAA